MEKIKFLKILLLFLLPISYSGNASDSSPLTLEQEEKKLDKTLDTVSQLPELKGKVTFSDQDRKQLKKGLQKILKGDFSDLKLKKTKPTPLPEPQKPQPAAAQVSEEKPTPAPREETALDGSQIPKEIEFTPEKDPKE